MIRALVVILHALTIAAPGFAPKREAALHVQRLAERLEFDPLTLVALVEHESRWNPRAFNPDTWAVGLGQVLLEHFPECVPAEPFSPMDLEPCSRIRARLEDWRYNLTWTAVAFRGWRAYCLYHVGTGEARYYLQGYQGFDAKRHATCGHVRTRSGWRALPIPKLTRRVLARRSEFERQVTR